MARGMAVPRTPRRAYDWEERYTQDARASAMREAVDRILVTSFPAISERLGKQQAPKQRQETAPAHLPVVKPETKPMVDPDFIDPEAYRTEESSEEDLQTEVDPMEELRKMEQRVASGLPPVGEPRPAVVKPNGGAKVEQRVEEDVGGDVEMAEGDEEDDEEDEEDQTACQVCQKADNPKQVLLCDGCDGEYHLYCLTPPLSSVPPGEWFCPECAVKKNQTASSSASVPTSVAPSTTAPAVADSEASDAMDVDDMPLSEVVRIKQERERALGWVPVDPTDEAATSVSIAQSFEQDAKKSNELLVHACSCDASRCVDPQFHEFCAHMKRFLRSACWASHNGKWLSYRIAKSLAELFAYHSLHCHEKQCNVPMCDELRAEEYV